MKYSHQRILALLSAVMVVLTLVLTFNPQLFQAFGLGDLADLIGGRGAEIDVDALAEDTPSDEGGDGFVFGDACGFLMGTATLDPPATTVLDDDAYRRGQISLSGVANNDQACADENGYFYENGTTRQSLVSHTSLGEIDFTWSSTVENNVHYDPVTGYWEGVARVTAASNNRQRWMEIDWDCPAGYDEDADCDQYRVKVDASGNVTGYAWIPAYGYVSLEGLTMEMAPRTVVPDVNVYSLWGDAPDDVTIEDAPLADGYEYWRVELTFVDSLTGAVISEDDIASLEMEVVPTQFSHVYLNQVTNKPIDSMPDPLDSAVRESTLYYPGGCVDGQNYCVVEEVEAGEVYDTFNVFIYSGAPTSNMLGMDDDFDYALEEYVDRNGCIWIYDDHWVHGTAPECEHLGYFDHDDAVTDYLKEEVYYDRESDRNFYALDWLTFEVEFSGDYQDAEVYVTDDMIDVEKVYVYDFYDTELSFRPRYQVNTYYASYGGYDYTTIPEAEEIKGTDMFLDTDARVIPLSDLYSAAPSGRTAVEIDIYNQLDADDTSALDPQVEDLYFMIDTDDDLVIDDTYRKDTITADGGKHYETSYLMGYDQDCGGCLEPSTNDLTAPTAEQWVCDYVVMGHPLEFGDNKACYYTAYLPLIDPHADPEYMSILGAINSTVEIDDFLELVAEAEDEDYSVLGSVNVATLRNDLYAMIARYTLGQTAGTGGDLDLGDYEGSSTVLSLMAGRLLYAEGDVHLTGGESSFGDPVTLVVRGGSVYVDENITGGRLGIIALENDGAGGNLYVDPSVTDIYANIFLDGSMFSESPDMSDGVPYWPGGDEVRMETLLNQLYLKGSLMSRNTLGGALDDDGDGSYPLGDGNYTNDYDVAVEYDLNSLRQYRLCYPLDAYGQPDETQDPEVCEDDGAELSGYLNEDGDEVYSSFIIEYEPADDLPVFVSGAGLD